MAGGGALGSKYRTVCMTPFIIVNLSKQLTREYGKGWSAKHLQNCLRIMETFPDEQFVSTLWRQLSWSHFKVLMYLDSDLKRDFYIEMCRLEK
ncbi:DUF1016 N-terminal domain-containing protein [Lunatimonas sp.]|uniref:DUF1016 N-terminal domain-containing protein n=1 Tax=Lunatimonas sp. TaxID=2060141 RepID=UPI00344C9CC8